MLKELKSPQKDSGTWCSLSHLVSLCRMLKELKSPQKDSGAWCSLSDRLLMAEDSLAAIRYCRRET